MKILILLLFIISFNFGNNCSAPLLGAAHSGAPGEVSCSGCHSGNSNSGPGIINFQIGNNNGFYSPNEILQIVLTVEQENLNQFGFQTVALKNTDNSNVGNFIITNEDETRLIEDNHNGTDRLYVGHTVCGADAEITGAKQWDFQWQSPEVNVGTINFYLAVLASNHNHSTTGDNTYTQIFNLSYNEFTLGDLNQDSIINILDVVILVGLILENIEMQLQYYEMGDMNNDNVLNVIDIVLVVNLILGN